MKRYKSQDRLIFLAITVLSILGIVMVGSASIGAATTNGSTWAITNIIKQLVFCLVGLFLMIVISRLYNSAIINRRTWGIVYVFMIGLLLSCLLWTAEKGTQAWIRGLPFGLTLQPSEFSKIVLVMILAYLLVDMPKKYRLKHPTTYRSLQSYENALKARRIHCIYKPLFVVLVAIAVIALIQNDTGTAVITLAICLASFFVAKERIYTKVQNLMLIGVLVVIVTLPLWYNFIIKGYMATRFQTWLNPLSDVTNTSQQVANALIAITNGGIFGVGLGNSTQKFGYIPEAHNDFISSIILEELGLIGLALILIPYMIIIYRLLKYAKHASDPKTTIVLTGIASYFFLHLFINLGGVSGLIPMTGVPLLFVSSGGSSTMAAFVAIGVAQALISKENKIAEMKSQS